MTGQFHDILTASSYSDSRSYKLAFHGIGECGNRNLAALATHP